VIQHSSVDAFWFYAKKKEAQNNLKEEFSLFLSKKSGAKYVFDIILNHR